MRYDKFITYRRLAGNLGFSSSNNFDFRQFIRRLIKDDIIKTEKSGFSVDISKHNQLIVVKDVERFKEMIARFVLDLPY